MTARTSACVRDMAAIAAMLASGVSAAVPGPGVDAPSRFAAALRFTAASTASASITAFSGR